MKVVFVYRKKHADVFSIEELFRTIAGELEKYAEVVEYECGSRWSIIKDVFKLRKLRADIYHVTGDINYITLLLPYMKTVLTVHDMGHYLYGLSGWRQWLYKLLWLIFPVSIARVVTSVSAETRDKFVKNLGIAEDRIRVIENCHSAIFNYSPHQFNVECPVILQVGTKPNKNLLRLIEALKGIPCRLCIIGMLSSELIQKLKEAEIPYQNRINLTHQGVFEEYIASDLVFFASLHEGFGLPIVEANSVGRPVITSNFEPMKSIAGDAACLVDPMNTDEIKQAILRIIRDTEYRERLVSNGLQNAKRYAPSVVAARYLDVYNMVCNKPRECINYDE